MNSNTKLSHVVLVIGANGMLASEIADFQKRLEKFWSGIPQQFFYLSHSDYDISDYFKGKEVFKEYKPDIVINCAAFTDVVAAEQEENREKAFMVNTVGPMNLARLCRENDAYLIQISTDYIFDGKSNTPYTTDMPRFIYDMEKGEPVKPINIPLNNYGEMKLIAEKEIVQSGCKYMIIRTSWLYSVNHNCFVSKIIDAWLHKEEISLVLDECGTTTRAANLAEFIVKTLIYQGNLYNKENQIYHYADIGAVSRALFGMEIIDFLETHFPSIKTPLKSIVYMNSDDSQVKRPKFSALSVQKTQVDFGNVCVPHNIALEDELKRLLEEAMLDDLR